MKKLLIFASGTKDAGGSGFQELVESSRTNILQADIASVVSNNESGGVWKRAVRLGIPFTYFPGPFVEGKYSKIIERFRPDFVALSGWLKKVEGLDPRTTINIHPGSLPKFGGKGMYGIHVHEAVIAAFRRKEIMFTEVTMHFVTEHYDEGPVFFRYPVLIRSDDTPETLAGRVGNVEHAWQSWITNLVIQGEISWDGKDQDTLKVPAWYSFHKKL